MASNSFNNVSSSEIPTRDSVPTSQRRTKMVKVGTGVIYRPVPLRVLLPIKKAIILKEVPYLEQAGAIIERDFFPDLPVMRTIVGKKDVPTNIEQEPESPATFETPVVAKRDKFPNVTITPSGQWVHKAASMSLDEFMAKHNSEDNININKFPNVTITPSGQWDHKAASMSLDEFMAKHNSEDNINFSSSLKKSEDKRKEDRQWLYGQKEDKTKDMLVVPSIEKQAEGFKRPFELDTWRHTIENSVMFPPKGVPENGIPLKKRRIVHSNTRLKSVPYDERQSQSQIQKMAVSLARSMEGKIGIDGKVVTATPSTAIITPRTPALSPGVAESPLMTYGHLEGTPYEIDVSSTPQSTGFSFQPIREREQIAYNLEKEASSKKKTQTAKTKTLTSPKEVVLSPETNPRHYRETLNIFRKNPTKPTMYLSDQSPAGKLYASLRKDSSPWFPSQSFGQSSAPSPNRAATMRQLVRPSAALGRPPVGKNLTDNLLKLPITPREPAKK